MKKADWIFEISNKPDITSYKWANKVWSILSTILLWFMWVCRAFSGCQWLKFLYRRAVKKCGKSNVDNKSGRINVPPIVCELYFIVGTILHIVIYFASWNNCLVKILTIYYLFETTVWILYYTIFRRFFEIGYTIYHQLEYLTMLFIIIPTQAVCFCNLWSIKFADTFIALLGAGDSTIPHLIRVMGAMFSAIVISMIISSFPTEAIKKTDNKLRMFIIGCGDVVKERLYPAIKATECASKVMIYDLDKKEVKENYCKYLKNSDAISNAVTSMVDKKDVIWIETPPNAHIPYLKKFLETKAKVIVVEKPIAIKEEELASIEKIIAVDKNRDRIFFLSYYILEKALPLFFLTSNNEKFRKYLDVEDESIVDNWRFLMGRMKKATVTILEGEDNRDWAFENDEGGQKLETFLHNVVIASLLCGDPQGWTDYKYIEILENKTCEISASAKSSKTEIELYLKKNALETELKRIAIFEFDEGKIEADFDKKSVRLYFNKLDMYVTIEVKSHFKQNYSIITDMVSRVAQGECSSFEIDGLSKQIESIRWLIKLRKK